MEKFLNVLITLTLFLGCSSVNYVIHWFTTLEQNIFLWHPLARFIFAMGEVVLAIFWLLMFLESTDD